MKALWNGEVIAESNEIKIVEGNHYFPADSIDKKYFQPSDTQTACHWKGTASYYTVDVNGETNQDAAWFYPTPSGLADGIIDHVAFWKGIEVTK
jgi:uncharacterized protein (DUF427 family)